MGTGELAPAPKRAVGKHGRNAVAGTALTNCVAVLWGRGGIRAARQGVWSFTTWGRTLKPREEAMDATSSELQR